MADERADERMDKVYVLSKVSFFTDLTTEELQELAEDFYWEDHAQGVDLIQQGEAKSRFYVLAMGRTEALMSKEGRSSWLVNFFGPGDAFGEISLFTGNAAPTTVRCVEHCEVLVLDAEHFARMMVRWPKLYPAFIEKLSHSLNRVNHIVWESKHKEFLRSALQLTQNEDKYYGLWGSVRTTHDVESQIQNFAQTDAPILLIGERGTGRQMLAWYIHKKRCGESTPFITVDGLRFDREWGDQIFESTNAGEKDFIPESTLFDVAEGGTLFIREINRMSPRAQLKLAQALQAHRKICLVVGSIEAPQERLEHPIIPELGAQFQQSYEMAPLRQRKRDISVLAQGILRKLALQYHREMPILNAEAMKLLLSHDYRQGNVTELIRVLERAFFLAEGSVIGLEHIFIGPTGEKIGRSIDLFSWEPIANVFKKGRMVSGLQRIGAGIFAVILIALVFIPSTRMGGLIFTLVWGLWWPVLTVVSPFLGRVWCTVCPFSFFMERVQKKWHLNRPVPDVFKKYNYLTMTFLFLLVFWLEGVTAMRSHPGYTALLLLAIQGSAVLVGVIYQRHAWCNYFCPLGSFVGMASIGAVLEIRSDDAVCLNHCTTADCYRGNGTLPGCPMSQHLPYIDNNLACKLCFNCVRNCPNSAVKFNLRLPGREIWHLVRVNQGFALFVGVSLAILIPLNLFEPFQGITHWRWWFSLSYWGSAVLGGGVVWGLAHPFKKKAASRRIKLTFALIPFMLSGYIMYQLHFVPGGKIFVLGFGRTGSAGVIQFASIPANLAGQIVAVGIGIGLSSFTVLMVFLYAKKNRTPHAGSVHLGQKHAEL